MEGDFENESTVEETAFHLFKPWDISISSLRNYFGEKIALYFKFLCHLTKWLSYMCLFALIV